MRISHLPSWHRFTYTQLYPAVLGSMLYDVLHVTDGWGALQVLELSITVLYCVDYFISNVIWGRISSLRATGAIRCWMHSSQLHLDWPTGRHQINIYSRAMSG